MVKWEMLVQRLRERVQELEEQLSELDADLEDAIDAKASLEREVWELRGKGRMVELLMQQVEEEKDRRHRVQALLQRSSEKMDRINAEMEEQLHGQGEA